MSKVTVSIKIENEHNDVRLVASTSQDLSNPIYSDSYTSINRVVKATLDNLQSNTRYYYGVMLDGTLHARGRGTFKTAPNPNTSSNFTCAFASCAETGSTHSVFTTIRDLNPDFFIHMGDIHYENINVNDINLYRSAYDKVFASPVQAKLYSEVPTVYMWDDHDFGANDSNANSPSKESARLAYRERVPHHILPTGDGNNAIYHSFVYGRVRFIVTDLRSEKFENSVWQMMSQTQRNWFYQELLKPEPFKVWINTVPWIGVASNLDEAWFRQEYTWERKEIANFIKNNGLTGKVAIISGDMHGIAIDDGTNSDYADEGGAPIPVFQAAALAKAESIKGGPWSHGSFLNGNLGNQYGVMNVIDDGETITIEWLGKRGAETVVSHTFQVQT